MTAHVSLHLDPGFEFKPQVHTYVDHRPVGEVALNDSARCCIVSPDPELLTNLGRALMEAAERLTVAISDRAEREAARTVNDTADPHAVAERFTGELRVGAA